MARPGSGLKHHSGFLEREGGGTDNELVFEFTFREREPTDSLVVPALRESVEFWRGHVEI